MSIQGQKMQRKYEDALRVIDTLLGINRVFDAVIVMEIMPPQLFPTARFINAVKRLIIAHKKELVISICQRRRSFIERDLTANGDFWHLLLLYSLLGERVSSSRYRRTIQNNPTLHAFIAKFKEAVRSEPEFDPADTRFRRFSFYPNPKQYGPVTTKQAALNVKAQRKQWLEDCAEFAASNAREETGKSMVDTEVEPHPRTINRSLITLATSFYPDKLNRLYPHTLVTEFFRAHRENTYDNVVPKCARRRNKKSN